MSNPLKILLANPRGFCAGVDRAIKIVEQALEKYGAPVYVRHQIVHNAHVVQSLEAKGVIFVKELDEIPETDQPVIFSAHGVAKSVVANADRRNFFSIDATCPLVSKVHREAEVYHKRGYQIIMIGHAGHPEVFGTMGQLPDGEVVLVETVEDAQTITVRNSEKLAMVTQTTLSVDDTAEIAAALKDRFPSLVTPKKEDICYATTNRQTAIKEIAPQADLVLVIGAQNSSNSNRLVETAKKHGCPQAHLINDQSAIEWSWFKGIQTVGISSGASAPEHLVTGVLEAIQDRFSGALIENVTTVEEDTVFNLPRVLAQAS